MTTPVVSAATCDVDMAVKSAACNPATCEVCTAPIAEVVKDCTWFDVSEASWLVFNAPTMPASRTAIWVVEMPDNFVVVKPATPALASDWNWPVVKLLN